MAEVPYHTKEHPAQHWMLIDIARSLGPTIHPAMAPIVERLKGFPHFGTASDEDVEEFDRVLKIVEEDWADLCAYCGNKIGDPVRSGKDDRICAACVEKADPELDKMFDEIMEEVEQQAKPFDQEQHRKHIAEWHRRRRERPLYVRLSEWMLTLVRRVTSYALTLFAYLWLAGLCLSIIFIIGTPLLKLFNLLDPTIKMVQQLID